MPYTFCYLMLTQSALGCKVNLALILQSMAIEFLDIQYNARVQICRLLGIDLIKIYVTGRNGSIFENRKKRSITPLYRMFIILVPTIPSSLETL